LGVILIAAWQPMAAQVQGVPSSAASLNSARSTTPTPGSHPNLATFSPNGYSNVLQPFLGNCCQNSFLPRTHFPPKIKPPLVPGHAGNSRYRGDAEALEAIAVPIYIPYAIGYGPDEDDGTGTDDSTYASDPSTGGPRIRKRFSDDFEYEWDTSEDASEEPPEEEPVVAQPATELVFKDGHHSSVVNYAIVGDALFDFDDGVTRKIMLADLDLAATGRANDVRGVDFNLPPASVAATTAK